MRRATTILLTAITVAVLAAADVGADAEYPWLGNQLGVTDEAPEPWTPVEIDGQTVRVWGREIAWDGGALPAQITSLGVPLLAAPIELRLIVDGERVGPPPTPQRLVEQRGGWAVLEHSASSPAVALSATTTVEFDGFTRVQLALIPEREVTVDAWELRIPMRGEAAEVFSRYLQYDFATQRTDKRSFATSMQFIEREIHEPFTPEVWVGNKQVGLAWAAETNLAWRQEQFDRAVSVLPGEGSTDLVVRFIDHQVTLTEPMTVEFALIATPLKPFDERLRQIRMGHPTRMESAIRNGIGEGVAGYYGISFGNDFAPQYDGIPFPSDSEKARAHRERLAQHGIGFIPYGAMAYTNAVYEPPRRYYEEWHTLPVSQATLGRYVQYDEGVTEDLGKPLTGHWDGYRVCMTPASYHDFFVDMYVRAIRDYDIDGIYLDHGEVSHGCQNPNHEHFIDRDEHPGKYFYGIFGARELLKRLWVAARAEKPGIVIVLHQSRPSRVLNSFVDIAATGEVINVFFCGEHTSRDIIADPSLYVPDYDTLPPVFFAMEFLESCGFDSRILPEVKFANQAYLEDHPELYDLWTRILMKNVLLSGARLYAGNMDQPVLEECWRGMDSLGPMTPEVTFAPWHEDHGLATPSLATTRVSVYRRTGRALLIVGSDATRDVDEEIALALPETYGSATDAATGQALALDGATVQVNVPARTFRMVLLTE